MTQSLKSWYRRALTALVVAALAPSNANACSMVRVTIQRWSSSTVSFIGTARADTAQAGPGDVSYAVASGHFGPAKDRIIFGQRVSVERLPEYAAEMLPNGLREVILVPWDYDASCHPTPWARSARWLEPGVRGIYTATLRAKSHWIKGVPTLDVMSPGGVPYIGNTSKSGETILPPFTTAEDKAPPMLSIEELFDVASYLPDPELLRRDPERATKPILQWAEAHGGISARYPASELVWNAVYALTTARMRRVQPEVAGTWRFTAQVPGDAERVFYGRTENRPTSALDAPIPKSVKRNVWDVPQPAGWYVLTGVDASLEKLSMRCANVDAQAYMSQRIVGDSTNTASHIEGDLELSLLNRAFGRDKTFKPYKTVVPTKPEDIAAYSAHEQGGVFFETGTDGVMRVSQPFVLEDGRILTLIGERLSRDVSRCGPE